jgi:hypothetical protein
MPLSFQNAGVPANVEDLAKALGTMSAGGEGGNALEGCDLLKLSQDGDGWVYGQDAIELEEGDYIAANPFSFEHGFISWNTKKNEIMGEMMVPINHAPPNRDNLINTGFEWDEQLKFKAKIVRGDEHSIGVDLVFKTNSHGGKEAIRNLARLIVSCMGQNPEHFVPIVSLNHTHYYHKSWKKYIYKPVFNIVGWMDLDGNEAEDAPKTEKAPAKNKAPAKKAQAKAKTKTKPEPEPEPEVEEYEEELNEYIADDTPPEDDEDLIEEILEAPKKTMRRRRR